MDIIQVHNCFFPFLIHCHFYSLLVCFSFNFAHQTACLFYCPALLGRQSFFWLFHVEICGNGIWVTIGEFLLIYSMNIYFVLCLVIHGYSSQNNANPPILLYPFSELKLLIMMHLKWVYDVIGSFIFAMCTLLSTVVDSSLREGIMM